MSGLEFKDGAEGAPLLGLEAFRVLIGRLDLPGHVVAVDEISLAAFETGAERTGQGGLRLLGLRVDPPPSAPSPEAAPAKAQEPVAAALVPHPTAPAQELPLVTLGRLDLGVRRLSFFDASKPGSVPLAIADLHLSNPQAIELLGADPEARPPVKLDLAARIDPVAGALRVGIEALPFADEPNLKIAVVLEGIHGDGLTAILPELKEKIDGASLADGSFKMGLETALKLQKRGPLAFDLAKGFGLDLSVRGIEFRGSPSGPVLAGLEELHVDVAKVDPATGAVLVRSVEIAKPAGRVSLEKDGLHVLGLVVKIPEAPKKTDAPVVAQAEKPAKVEAPAEPAKSPAAAPRPAAPEIRVDRLVVSGLDFTAEDRTCEPALLLPLTGLDLEAMNITTKALTEEQDIRFDLRLKSGKVPLPVPAKGGLTEGLLGVSSLVASLAGGSKDAPKLEDREVFEEIGASGRIGLYPGLRGWLKAGVNALELTAFQGPAARAGVTIGAGVLDNSTDVRFDRDGSMSVALRPIFSDLGLSESSGGPISKVLKLSMPLDSVIFLLRNEYGEIKVPIAVTLDAGGKPSLSEISRIAITTLSTQIAKAVANSPFRLVNSAANLVPLGGGGDPKAKSAPQVLSFAPGDPVLVPVEIGKIGPVLEQMRDDRSLSMTLHHESGSGDFARAKERVNPSTEDCLRRAAGLKERRTELLAVRAPAATRARIAVASRLDGQDREPLENLRAIDRELGQIENALDHLYRLLRAGAERQAAQRTRAACIVLGRDRLAAVRAALTSSGIPGIEERIRIAPVRFAEAEGSEGGRVVITTGRSKG